jgi:hypothetical protein
MSLWHSSFEITIITTDRIADGAVTNPKIADYTIRPDKIDTTNLIYGTVSIGGGASFTPTRGFWAGAFTTTLRYSVYDGSAWHDGAYGSSGFSSFFNGTTIRIVNPATSTQTLYYLKYP